MFHIFASISMQKILCRYFNSIERIFMVQINGALQSIFYMFVEMAPYIVLGLSFVAILNIIVTKDWVSKNLGKRSVWTTIKAALLGIPLPLCSCGVIPTAIYMNDNKASKGSVVSFLISTPQTGVDSIIATYGMMGPVFAIYRPIAALLMGIFGGLFALFAENQERKRNPINPKNISFAQIQPMELKIETTQEKIKRTLRYAFIEFVDDIALRFIFGVIVAGLIAYFVPANFFAEMGLGTGLVGMLILIAISAPMYICATASIPIAVALMAKGFSPGAAFVFLAAGPATSIASFAILSKALGKQLTIFYVGVIVVLSIVFGYILDFIFYFFNLNVMDVLAISGHSHHNHAGEGISFLPMIVSQGFAVLFAVLLLGSIYRKYIKHHIIKFTQKSKEIEGMDKINISGMTCNHCVANVTKAIQSISGIEKYEVDLNQGLAMIKGTYDKNALKEAIEKAGYDVAY